MGLKTIYNDDDKSKTKSVILYAFSPPYGCDCFYHPRKPRFRVSDAASRSARGLRSVNKVQRRAILKRRAEEQGWRCCYCKRPFTMGGKTRATIEHIEARMDGGGDNVGNLKAACLHCNQHRGTQMNQARQRARALLAMAARPV